MKRISLRLDDDTHRRLKLLLLVQGGSIEGLLRTLVAAELGKHKKLNLGELAARVAERGER